MEIEFSYNTSNTFSSAKNVCIKNNQKQLKLIFGGNGDLYFVLGFDKNSTEVPSNASDFCITKNDECFSIFKNAFDNIINCNVFAPSEFKLMMCQTKEEKIGCMKNAL